MRYMLRIAALISAAALMIVAPAASQARSVPYFDCERVDSTRHSCNTSLALLPTYQGWAHVSSACPGGAYIGDEGWSRINPPRTAWRWTSQGWRSLQLSPGSRVYIYPYAVAWSWAWTSDTGWVAIRDSDVTINPFCLPVP